MESLLESLREVASDKGDEWLQGKLQNLLREAGRAPATSERALRPRRSRPPVRLSPDYMPRAERRRGSPRRDPPSPPPKRTPGAKQVGQGRNPSGRRGDGASGTAGAAPPACVGRESALPATSGTGERAQRNNGQRTVGGRRDPSAASLPEDVDRRPEESAVRGERRRCTTRGRVAGRVGAKSRPRVAAAILSVGDGVTQERAAQGRASGGPVLSGSDVSDESESDGVPELRDSGLGTSYRQQRAARG